MTTLNLSLSDDLHAFLSEQASRHGYSDTVKYLQDVLADARRRAARDRIESALLEALASGPAVPWKDGEWDEIERAAEQRAAELRGK